MADGTHIEWTDATWNIINGCTVLSPGCTNCYAMRLAGTRLRHHPSREGLTQESNAGPVWNGQVRLYEPLLHQPRRWTRPRMIFVCAHGDLGHPGVDDRMLDSVFAAMLEAPQHIYQILTKRPERFTAYFADLPRRQREMECHAGMDWLMEIPANWWFGISAEDQKRYDQRWPVLAQLPAQVRWISAEPLLGHIDILAHATQPNWVVAGGESGPGARPMHPDWARSLRDQCAAVGVAFLFKQWGSWAPHEAVANEHGGVDIVPPVSFRSVDRWRRWESFSTSRAARDDESIGEFLAPGALAVPMSKKDAGRLLDGAQHDGMPS
jgi:protein gp37